MRRELSLMHESCILIPQQLIDPGNGKPLYRYTGNFIDKQEVHDLLEEGRYLRIVARPLAKRVEHITRNVRAML